MPWVLSAAFKVIKSWLPEKAVKKIKFVSKKDLKDWVPKDQALTCWGGEDDYTFSFVPEFSVKDEITISTNNRKVRFDDGTQMSEVGSTISTTGEDGALLSVSPEGLIKFSRDTDNECISNLVLQNISSSPVSFKVKTTSPEKFRVRPGYGCLSSGGKVVVTVCLLPAYRASNVAKDKFLILSTTVESIDLSNEELTNLWKNTSTKKGNQIHLRCAPLNDVAKNGSVVHTVPEVEPTITKLTATIRDMKESQKELYGSVKTLLYVQISLIVLLLAAILYLITSQNNHAPSLVEKSNSP
ncbi:hypothetical protein HHI36_018634 [Cryptolaemus montrouzieri]|uniref:MSP domain-containing protein n=1 Tax=Cryptolaemus montrouzieri TaxID=559131 RepID=A0ABD2P0I1_9CUCU